MALDSPLNYTIINILMNTTLSTHILIISQKNIGASMLEIIQQTLNQPLPDITTIDIPIDCDADKIYMQLLTLAQTLKPNTSLLILTDLYGSTPCNVANKFSQEQPNYPTRVIAGLNLAMLLRIFNYRHLPLEELASKAYSGAHDGIIYCENL